MAIVGGIVAGSVEVFLGSAGCFIVDSGTCWLSVLAMWLGVKGSFNVRKEPSIGEDENRLARSNCWVTVSNEFRSTFRYLTTCGFGMLVGLKGTGSIILGPEDIVGIELATVNEPDGSENEQESSFRVGLLFALIGLGNLMGPTIMNIVTDAKKPRTLQRACWLSCIYQAAGWIFIAYAPDFAWFLVATVIRTLGAGMIYTYSSLLLQSLSDKEMLGRVLSVEYTIYVLAHALSASLSGYLYDKGVKERGLSWFGAIMAVVATAVLGTYHFLGYGAAQLRFNTKDCQDKDGVFLDSSDRISRQPLPPVTYDATDELELSVNDIEEKFADAEIL